MTDYEFDENYSDQEYGLDEFLAEEYDDADFPDQAVVQYEANGPDYELYERLAESFETLNQHTVGMTTEEAEDYITGEWVQAIIPLVTALAPVAAKAIGGLVNRVGRNRRRPAARPAQRPAPRRPVSPRPSPAANNQAMLNGFLQLLQNPQVIQALQAAMRRR